MLLDVPIGLVEQLPVAVEPVLEQRPAQGLFHLAFAGARVLPAGEAHDVHDLVDIVDHASQR
jgi:hypothetical protein